MLKRPKASRVAVHRPAIRRRRFKHDELTAVDLFSGFGGLTKGIEDAGFTAITAANHNDYKVEVHETNHPHVEHWIADLANPEASDYHSARDLPAADLLAAGVTCTNHSQANTQKAYAQPMSLFDLDDPDFDARVTRSERDRATANCVLHYAAAHHPRLVLIECTTELTSWGPAQPGKAKIGDGSTYRWWLKQFNILGYGHRVLYLNSMFFGVPQSRDRLYIAFWDKRVPAPDLDHRPIAWCGYCNGTVEAEWTWRTGVPPTGSVRYGKQYDYRCPRCRFEVFPATTPSLAALDLTDLGTRIGDKPVKNFYNAQKEYIGSGPMAPATMARAQRCLERFGEFPAILMPDSGTHGVERRLDQPLATQTSRQETALLSTGAVIAAHKHNGDGQHVSRPMDTMTTTHEKALLFGPSLALGVDNFQGIPRGADEPFPTQTGSENLGILSARILPNRTNGTSRSMGESMETLVGNAGSGGLGVLSSGIVPFRRNTVPTSHNEAMPTVTSDQVPGLLTAAGRVQCNGSIDEAKYRAYPVERPLGTVVGSAITQGLLFSGWAEQNTGPLTAAGLIQQNQGIDHRVYPAGSPLQTLVGAGNHASVMFSGWTEKTAALAADEWRAMLADLQLEDCYFRMLAKHEVGRGCGFDVDFPGYQGSFEVWGSARDQVDGFGNAVSPQVGQWIGERLRAALHGEVAA